MEGTNYSQGYVEKLNRWISKYVYTGKFADMLLRDIKEAISLICGPD